MMNLTTQLYIAAMENGILDHGEIPDAVLHPTKETEQQAEEIFWKLKEITEDPHLDADTCICQIKEALAGLLEYFAQEGPVHQQAG